MRTYTRTRTLTHTRTHIHEHMHSTPTATDFRPFARIISGKIRRNTRLISYVALATALIVVLEWYELSTYCRQLVSVTEDFYCEIEFSYFVLALRTSSDEVDECCDHKNVGVIFTVA